MHEFKSLSATVKKREAFADDINQDQTAQNMYQAARQYIHVLCTFKCYVQKSLWLFLLRLTILTLHFPLNSYFVQAYS